MTAPRRGKAKATPEEDARAVLASLADLPEPDRALGQRLHAIITTTAPDLAPRLWYGMPGYAHAGHVVCFFQSAQKFKTRYCTLGFNDHARLDDGPLWPVAFALAELTPAVEAEVAELVRRAVA